MANGRSEAEALLSSTWREPKAVYLVLRSFTGKLAGHTVKWFTDNQGVIYIICSGSKKQHLQEGAIEICSTLNWKWSGSPEMLMNMLMLLAESLIIIL